MRVSDDASAALLIQVKKILSNFAASSAPAPSAMPKPFTTAPDEDQESTGYFSTSP
jgi:hypothetical protein